MIKHRLARTTAIGGVFLGTLLLPAIAFAQQAGAAAPAAAATPWQVSAARAIGAALAMGLAAVGAGYAQGNIGAAGAGTLAERPEMLVQVITLIVLPEIIVLLGFVSMILINAK
jgi:V/A-type H+-transporting ATPase subunit K